MLAKRLSSSLSARVDEDDSPGGCEEHLDICRRRCKRLGCDGLEIRGWVFDETYSSRRMSLVKPLLGLHIVDKSFFTSNAVLDNPVTRSVGFSAQRKGQEWKSVFVLNVVDGCIPSDMSTGNADDIEEERRLLYVAMTRAKDQLALIVPHRFYVHNQARGGDKHLYASRSRFIPSAVVSQFELCSWQAAGHQASVGRTSSGVTVDLAARMRDRWRATGS